MINRKIAAAAVALAAGSAFAAAPAALDMGEVTAYATWAVASIGAVFAGTIGIPLAKKAFHAVTGFLGR